MLKRLIIKNFKSHLSTTIDFSSGMTIIVGDPQTGKTNILRGFIWLCTNPVKMDVL